MDNLSKRIDDLSPAKRALLELRLKQSSTGVSGRSVIPPRANPGFAVLSFAQRRLWFIDQIEPNRALYNVPRALRLLGKLDAGALERTLNELVRRHEPFRTHFADFDGEVRQVIDAPEAEHVRITLSVTDLSDLPEPEREAKANQLIRSEGGQPFSLSHGPMIRAGLLRLAQQEHILLLTTHHIVSDAWSAGILFRELGEIYDAFASGQPSPLPPLSIQYADFAEWQTKWLRGDELERQLGYWRKQLEGATGVLDLPADHPRTAVFSPHVGQRTTQRHGFS